MSTHSEKEVSVRYRVSSYGTTSRRNKDYILDDGILVFPPGPQGSSKIKFKVIDDKIDDLHYWTTFIKFGLGRASYDSAQEIRNSHLTREEGLALVERFDGEFPDRYFDEIMNHLDIKPDTFHSLCDEIRSPHLWKRSNDKWSLRHNDNLNGTDD